MPYLGNIPSPIILQDVLGNYNFDYGTLYIDSVNNRVGIGTSSPASKLELGTLGAFCLQTGSVKFTTTPTAGATDGLIWDTNNAAAYYQWKINGTNSLFINASGNVGIGTVSPSSKLHVRYDAGSVEGYTSKHIFQTTDQKLVIGTYWQPGVGQYAYINSTNDAETGATDLLFKGGSSERMRITSAGYVGIGTSSPTKRLHVYDSTSVVGNPTIRLEGATGGYGAGIEAGAAVTGGSYVAMGKIVWDGENSWNTTSSTQDSYMTIHTTSDGTLTERMRITSAGNVGIGTTSPSFTLDVNGSARSSYILFGSNLSAPTADAAIYRPADGTLGFVTASTERMRIASGGSIYMGTTTASLAVRLAISYTGAGSMYGIEMRPTSSGSTYALYMYNSAGSYVGGINPTDSVTNYLSASDYRLKENVVALNDPIERLKQLLPRRFNFKNDPNNTVDGFIAHEVSPIVPEAVNGEKDQIDKNGNPVYQGMDNSKLVPLLTACIQKAIEKIEMLESRIQQLETN